LTSKLDSVEAPPTEELIQREEFVELLDRERRPKTYIGFEISGKVHLGTGIVSMSKVRDLQAAGFDCTVFLADWHSWLNGKLGGDLQTIKEVAGGYFKEGLSIGLKSIGGDPSAARFVMGSEIYDQTYWATLVNVSKGLTVSRVQRMITIMGRKEGENADFAQLIYPPMQIADIFHLGVDVAHGGKDQRKAHVGAREVAEKIGKKKPLALHHYLLLGLTGPRQWPLPENMNANDLKAELKMSKSKPDSAVFIHDSEKEVERKIRNAFCPERETGFNPVIELAEFVVFPARHRLSIERPAKYGGNLELKDARELKSLYGSGKIHPLDLKTAVTASLVEILGPARQYFDTHPELTAIFERVPVTR